MNITRATDSFTGIASECRICIHRNSNSSNNSVITHRNRVHRWTKRKAYSQRTVTIRRLLLSMPSLSATHFTLTIVHDPSIHSWTANAELFFIHPHSKHLLQTEFVADSESYMCTMSTIYMLYTLKSLIFLFSHSLPLSSPFDSLWVLCVAFFSPSSSSSFSFFRYLPYFCCLLFARSFIRFFAVHHIHSRNDTADGRLWGRVNVETFLYKTQYCNCMFNFYAFVYEIGRSVFSFRLPLPLNQCIYTYVIHTYILSIVCECIAYIHVQVFHTLPSYNFRTFSCLKLDSLLPDVYVVVVGFVVAVAVVLLLFLLLLLLLSSSLLSSYNRVFALACTMLLNKLSNQ